MKDEYTILKRDVVSVTGESPEYYKLLSAGWFTWDRGDDGERIMTRDKDGLPVSKILRRK